MLEDSSVRAAAGGSELGDGHAGAGFAASQVYGVFARRSVCRGCLRTHVPLHSYTPRRRSRSHRRGSARQGNGRGPPHLVVYDRQGAELIEIREYDSLERALEDRLMLVIKERYRLQEIEIVAVLDLG